MADAADTTVSETRRQNDLIGLTLFFAVLATLAALRSANAAHKALTGLERPYVVVESTTALAQGDAVHAGITIVNHGRSPATIREIALGGIVAMNPWEAFFDGRYSLKEHDLSIDLPDSTKPHSTVKLVEFTPLRANVPEEHRNKARRYVFGRVRYDTLFGGQFERTFFWEFRERDDLKQVGGAKMNRDRRRNLAAWLEGIASTLGYLAGRYLPPSDRFREFVARRAKRERERHDRPDPRA